MRSESKILAGKGRALLVVNPCAGRTKGRLYADLLETHLHNAGVPVIRCETTAEENGASYAASAALAGCRRIFCIGGDGTLNAVINGMLGAGANLPITYIPAGTTNDFARTLKLPRRIGDMRRVLASGRDVAIDAGRFNDGYFSYVASFGAFSNTVSIGGMLHYDSALVDMNDGKLEMLLIRKPENLGEVRRLVHALGSSDFDDPLFDFAASSAFHLKTEQGFDWSVDGERAAGGTAVEIACVKSAVRITVPARKD